MGAKSLGAENKQVPEGPLVLGSPPKVVKALEVQHRAMFTKSAMPYVDNAHGILTDLARIDK